MHFYPLLSRPRPAILPSIDPSEPRFWRPAANSRTIGLTKKVHILTSGILTSGIPARRYRLSVISPVVCCRLPSSNRTHPAQVCGSGAQPSHTAGNKWRRSLVFTHADAKQLSLSAGHCGPYQEIQT